jgi:hypothetical protein
MPITGTFGADFSAFQTAVDQATTKLITFEGNATNVTNSLSRMEKSFSGVKIIQDATLMADAIERVGGVSKLTADELERAGNQAQAAADKMRAMGMDVPEGIQRIADAAKSTSGAWSEFVQGFDVKEAIEHPMAAATDAVKALATEMGPATVAALGFATGVAAVAVGLFELTEHAAKVGGELNDLSERTGVGVVQLSKYANAAAVAGADLGTVGDAMFKLQKGIGEDSPKVAEGLDKIGLSMQDIKDIGIDQQLDLIATALAATEDPAARAAAMTEIFRDKTGALLPVLLKLHEAMAITNDISPWTPQQAADAEKFEMQMASMKVHAEAFAVSLGRDLIPAVSGLVEVGKPAVSWLAEFVAESSSIPGILRIGADAVGYLTAAYETLTGKTELPIKILVDTEDAKKKLDEIRDKAYAAANAPAEFEKNWVKAFTNAAAPIPTLETALKNLTAMQEDSRNVTMEQAKEAQKLADAFGELASAGAGWKGTLDTIDGSVVEAIAGYRESGVSLQALKVIYSDLTDTQFASIEKLITARHDEVKQLEHDEAEKQKLEAKTIEMTTKLWDEYYAVQASRAGTATDARKAALDRQYNDAAATAVRMGIADKDYWDALEARWKQGTESLGVDWAALQKAATTESKAGLQQIADGAKATYAEALKHVGEWSDASIEKFRTTAEEAQKAADMFGTGWADNADKAKRKVDEMTSSVIGSIHAIAAASASATIPAGASNPYPDTAEGRLKMLADQQARNPTQFINASGMFGGLPAFGGGGSGDFGSGTPVMLHGKEAVVPLDNSNASNILYGGAAGIAGSTINLTVNVTQPLGTPDQVARAVGDAQVSVLKGQGLRLPYGT